MLSSGSCGGKRRTDMVCMSRFEFERMRRMAAAESTGIGEGCAARDLAVLRNPLHPPENRMSCPQHRRMADLISRGHLYQHTNAMGDSYRLVAYITNDSTGMPPDVGGNRWKLFAMEGMGRPHRFFISPIDVNNDIKIPITEDTLSMQSAKLRDVYSIPESLVFNTPLMRTTPYTVTEIPRTDFFR